MFDPSKDRIEYGKELAPPSGFHLVRAVATTFSLDLQTLVSAMIPLGLSADVDDEAMQNPVALMHAIRRLSSRLVIFCEAGQIKLPPAANALFPLLDKMIVEVHLPKQNGIYPSFHPKSWTLEYENSDGEKCWRFVVLSRNLTNDRSWDVSVSLDGHRERGSFGATKDLVGFLKFLHARVNKGAGTEGAKSVVEKLISGLDGVSFFCEGHFDSFDIIPIGIGKSSSDFLDFERRFSELVVVSPFLSDDLMKSLNAPLNGKDLKNTRRILITREDAIGKLKPESADRFEKYVLKDVQSEETGGRSDLHAKLFMVRRWSDTELYLGSMNATKSGYGRNVEMMMGLYTKNRHLNAEKLLRDICGADPDDPKSALRLVEDSDIAPPEINPDEKDRHDASDVIRVLSRCKPEAKAVAVEGGYRVMMRFGSEIPKADISAWPLNAPGMKTAVSREFEFPGTLPVTGLSELFAFAVRIRQVEVTCLLKVRVAGIPEGRDDAVLNEIVRDRQSMMRYLVMLLSADPSVAMNRVNGIIRSGGKDLSTAIMPGLYEEMLTTAAESPERIAEAGAVLSRLKSDDELLMRYREVYLRFAEALHLKTEAAHD